MTGVYCLTCRVWVRNRAKERLAHEQSEGHQALAKTWPLQAAVERVARWHCPGSCHEPVYRAWWARYLGLL